MKSFAQVALSNIWMSTWDKKTFQEEGKHILRKMPCGIKTLYSIRDCFPQKVRSLLLNALAISHLHYPAILLNGLTENLNTASEKQMNWE